MYLGWLIMPVNRSESTKTLAVELLRIERRKLLDEVEVYDKAIAEIEQAFNVDQDSGFAYVTVSEWYFHSEYDEPTRSNAIHIGKAATKFCSDNGIEIRTVDDERWGTVNSYPAGVIDEVMSARKKFDVVQYKAELNNAGG